MDGKEAINKKVSAIKTPRMKTRPTHVWLGIFVFMCVACLLVACGIPKLTDIQIQSYEMVVVLGQTADVPVSYVLDRENATDAQLATAVEKAGVDWHSDNEDVATVKDGQITTHSAGTAIITVADASGSMGGEMMVDVVVPLEGAQADDEIKMQAEGETATIGLSLSPADASLLAIEYSVEDEQILEVDKAGNLAAAEAGETTLHIYITAFNSEGSKETTELSTKVTVLPKAEDIGLEEYAGLLYIGETLLLEPFMIPEEAVESAYAFQSSDETVATVDENGLITALSVGSATISITNEEGLETEYNLTVLATGAGTQMSSATGASGDSSKSGGSGSGSGNGGQGGGTNGGSGTNTSSDSGPGGSSGNNTGNSGENDGLSPDDDDYVHDGGRVIAEDEGKNTDGLDGDGWDNPYDNDNVAGGEHGGVPDDGQAGNGIEGDAW